MQVELERYAGAEPPAHQRDAAALIAQQLERAPEFGARHLAERRLDIRHDGAAVLIDEIAAGPLPQGTRADLCQRRLAAQLEFVAQRLLKAGIARETELRHQAQNC